jgi:hypothetical protein
MPVIAMIFLTGEYQKMTKPVDVENEKTAIKN